jgi:hypothetical protein
VAPLRRAGRRGGTGLLLRRGGARGSAYVRRSPDIEGVCVRVCV